MVPELGSAICFILLVELVALVEPTGEGGTRPGGQPANQNAFRMASNLFAHLLWALAAEDVDINSLDIYRGVLAARSRLRNASTTFSPWC